jgi:hypothetical protein
MVFNSIETPHMMARFDAPPKRAVRRLPGAA